MESIMTTAQSATHTAKPTTPVVVTFREVEKVLTGAEAVGQIQEAANRDPDASPIERATVAAAMGNILNQLRRCEQEAGALVLTAPHHGPASRLQSLIASGEGASVRFEPLPTGGVEAKFDTEDWIGWAGVAWQKLKHLKPHRMLRPAGSTPDRFPEAGRIALLGDWGTGLYGAPRIADTIRHDRDPFAMLMHLGDVYYSGTGGEVRERFLDLWPVRPEAMNRARNSNHEMYSGGDAYFGSTLARVDQKSSYFALQNKHWTLVGLDVAYRDHDIDDEQVAWVREVLAQAGARKVILFSHHQLYSHFESQGSKLFGHPGFGAILRSKRIFAWYWGHEHRCTIFEEPDQNFGLYARCIGHSGMPQSHTKTRNLPRATARPFERGDWRRSTAQIKEGNPLPSCVVLEGRNPYIKNEEDKFTPHGYAVLTLDGPVLKEQILDPTGVELYANALAS
jgi:hypothetical protein